MADIDWVAAGVTAMALWDVENQYLVRKGVLSQQEREQIMDEAIMHLSGNPNTQTAAENIRTIFKRP